MSTLRCAWLASSASLSIHKWARRIDRKRVTPVFVQLGGEPGTAEGFMSFSCARDGAALADLLRALELDALIVHGVDVLSPALAAAKALGMAVQVTGATEYEDQVLAQWLPGQYADARHRARFMVLPPPAQDSLAGEMAQARRAPRAKIESRLLDRRDGWNAALRAFPELAANAVLAAQHEAGYRLQPSGNLQAVESHAYWLTFDAPVALAGITLVPILEFSDTLGILEIDWGRPDGERRRAAINLARLGPLDAVRFALPQDDIAAGESRELRLRLIGANRPVRLLEMRRYRWGGTQVSLQPLFWPAG